MATKKSDPWKKFLEWADQHGGGAYLFRGQGDTSPIKPKIARPDYNYSASREKSLFNAFISRARPFVRMPIASEWEWLALAQHHGAPTRLTDWSTSALVAAWFAVTSHPLDTPAAVYALETERDDIKSVNASNGQVSDGSMLASPLDINSGVYLMETSPVSTRITTQRGLFTLHGEPNTPLCIPKGHCFMIPTDERAVLQNKLLDFGIEASHIFPELDGLCKSLDWRMRTGKGFLAFT